MRAPLVNRAPAISASIAGEWSLYVCVLLAAYQNAGRLGAFAYFAACVLSWLLVSEVTERAWGRVALVGAAAAGLVAVLTEAGSPWVYLAAGAVYGGSAKFQGRVPGPCAGAFGSPSWAGVAGASAAVVAILIWNPATVAAISATVSVLGAVLAQQGMVADIPGEQGEAPPVISFAALGLCFAAGLRAAEPAMGVDPESALFFIPAWAAGAQLVSTVVSAADPRAVLSAPFVAAIALAAMGPVEGPGLLFLYMGVGASVALVTGWFGRVRWQTAAAFIAGGVWASFGGVDFDMTVWVAGAAALAGGFATLILAYRVPEPAPASAGPPLGETSVPVIDEVVVTAQADPTEIESIDFQAALVLRDALAEARQIRQNALDRFRRGVPSIGQSVDEAKTRARRAAEELEATLESLLERISAR